MKKTFKNPFIYLPLFTILSFLSSTPAFWLVRNGSIEGNSVLFFFLVTIGAFFTMLILPSFLIKYIWGENTSSYGLRMPEKIEYAVKLTFLAFVPIISLIILLSRTEAFRSFYITDPKLSFVFFIEIILSFIYFFSEEFLFRGFLLFSLWEKLGQKGFWVINIIFSLLHVGKASGEVFISFFIGIVFSYLSIKTQSIWPAVILHFCMAILLNFLIFFSN